MCNPPRKLALYSPIFAVLAAALSITALSSDAEAAEQVPFAQLVPAKWYEPEVSNGVREIAGKTDSLGAAELVEQLENLSVQGDNSADEFLGELFLFGALGLERNEERGCDYFERVYRDRPDAAHNLATCFFNGGGRAEDLPRARELYLLALRGGWRQAPCALGNMLIRGQGGPVDVEQGMALCRLAAGRGDPDAATDLGGYLLTGEFGPRDPVAARLMLSEAAAKGQINAAHLLGQIYAKGDGVAADPELAENWFRKAHEGGRPDSARQLLNSLLRRGYRQTEEGVVIAPELLGRALEWAHITVQVDPSAEERARAENLIPELEALIQSAQEH